MGAVRDENFVVEHGWMINRFGLKGNDLRVYAIIYGFSQTGDQWFTGGLQYLADWVCGTKQGVIKNLKTLLETGLIEKRESTVNGVKMCSYRATPLDSIKLSLTGHETEFNGGMKPSLTGRSTELNEGVKRSLPNNISIKDTDIDIKKEGAPALGPLPASEKKSSKKEKIDTEAILQRYTQDAKALELLREWLKVRKAKRAPETEKALTLNLDKLAKLALESGLSVPGYLEAVIARGWAAFYPIRENLGQAPRAARSRVRAEEEHNAGQHASGFGWG